MRDNILEYILAVSIILSGGILKAQDVSIDKTREELENINKEIKEKIEKQYKLYEEEKNILYQIQRCDKLLEERKEILKRYNRKLSDTERSVSDLKWQLSLSGVELKKIEEDLKLRVLQIYKEGRYKRLKILLSALNYKDFLKRYNFLVMVANKDLELKDGLQKQKYDISGNKKQLEIKYEYYSEQKGSSENKEKDISGEKEKKKKLLKDVRDKKVLYEQTINELKDQSSKLESLVKEFNERTKATKVTVAQLEGDIIKNKGKLPFPANGKVITYYGKYKHPKFNVYIFNNGIEISAKLNDDVYSIYKGVVLFADWFKGYGKTVLIDYGEGIVGVYGHLSEISVNVGQKVLMKDVIGKVGDTGSSENLSLYFEIRNDGKPENPMEWIKN